MSKDMQTDLARVRGLGAAKSGTSHFWQQRITAIANIPLMGFLVFTLVYMVGADYDQLSDFLAKPWVGTIFVLLIINMFWHMRLGAQMVIEDYVHSTGLKIFLLIMNNFFTAIMGAFCVLNLLRIIFTA